MEEKDMMIKKWVVWILILLAALVGTVLILKSWSGSQGMSGYSLSSSSFPVLHKGDRTSFYVDDMKITWEMTYEGPTRLEYEITIQNLRENSRAVQIDAFIESLDFDLDDTNVEIFEWTQVEKDVKTYVKENRVIKYELKGVKEVNPVDKSYFKAHYMPFSGSWDSSNFAVVRFTDGREMGIGYEKIDVEKEVAVIEYVGTVMKEVVTKKRVCDWVKMDGKKSKKSRRLHRVGDKIQLPKLGSLVEKDDFGYVSSSDGSRKIKLVVNVPMVNKWGSEGMAGIYLDGKEDPVWWNTSWQYRRAITLHTNENVTENYQYMIVLDKFDNLNGHCRDDFGDIRFLENEDGGELSYWIENYIYGDNAVFWVKREDNSLSDNTIYVYYGNPSATSVENGDRTFLFFDDFSDPNTINTKWTINMGTWYIDNGVLFNQVGTGPTIHSIFSGYDYSAVVRVRATTQTSYGDHLQGH